jgi:PAS domain S-box-containing protein
VETPVLNLASLSGSDSREVQTLVDSLPQLVWTARPDGSFSFFNQTWCDYTGQTHGEAIQWGFKAALNPLYLNSVVDEWEGCVRDGTPFERELQLRRCADDTYRWHLCRITPIKDSSDRVTSWIGAATDITDLIRRNNDASDMLDHAMDAASRQQTFLREVLASLTDGNLWLCDSIVDLPPMRSHLIRGFSISSDTFGKLRHDIYEVAQRLGFSAGSSMNLLTAVGEAAMNAMIYCGGGTVRVHTDETKTLQIWIEDAGPTAPPSVGTHAAVAHGIKDVEVSAHGHGFQLMTKMVDRMWLLTEQDGSTIVMEHDCDDLRDEPSDVIDHSPDLVF